MSFKKNKYIVIKKALSKEFCEFLWNYSIVKRDFYREVNKNKNKYITNLHLGTFGDAQIPGSNTYRCYGDLTMETILLKLQGTIEKNTKLNLVPTYSYTRFYVRGDELKKHKDREACEISATLFYGGDKWPIYVDDKKIELNYGDVLIYRGMDVEHWRKPFNGNECFQVFLHYNDVDGPFKYFNKNDKRFFIGAPVLAMDMQ